MTIPFERQGPPITEADLDAFESRLGQRLPADYRQFMLSQNGGRPIPNYLPSNPNVGIGVFFCLTSDDQDDSMAQMLDVYSDRYPPRMLPIAESAGGNLICLSLTGDDENSVYFWEHEMESDEGEPPREDNLEKIADSFADLLENLDDESDLANNPDVIRMVATGKVTFSDPDFKPEFD